jgi:hypothetical protein
MDAVTAVAAEIATMAMATTEAKSMARKKGVIYFGHGGNLPRSWRGMARWGAVPPRCG